MAQRLVAGAAQAAGRTRGRTVAPMVQVALPKEAMAAVNRAEVAATGLAKRHRNEPNAIASKLAVL